MVDLASVAKWLDDLDGHGIYKAAMLDELAEYGVDPGYLPTHSYADTVRIIRARGLGGTLDPDDGGQLCYGYEVARSLVVLLLGVESADHMSGRGSGFRANLATLHAAADATT